MAANPKPPVAPSQDYRTLHAERLTPTIGAILSGIDLTQPLSDDQLADLKQALADHQVIFFRNQHLDPSSLKRVGRYFGQLQIHALQGLPDHPAITQHCTSIQ